jgi:uncharacterized protein YdeI (YjbR/CyaY-like superfamily)
MRPAKAAAIPAKDLPILLFENSDAWAKWLEAHHAASPGLWVRLAKKDSSISSLTYREAVEVALCYGWIDGQKRAESTEAWLQKFTPRANKSIWSKINRQKALELIKSGHMKPAGLKEVERAKKDGRWKSAYDSPSMAAIPEDFQAALDRNARAKAFYGTLEGWNRYAILFRLQNAKKPETRARRIQQFVAMLEKHEKIHP